MFFNTLEEIIASIQDIPQTRTGRRQYPVLFKKAVCEFLSRNTSIGVKTLVDVTPFSTSLIYRWKEQHEEGLYTMEGMYNVSKKSKKANASILERLNTEINLLERKRQLVIDAAELGLSVTDAQTSS